MKDLFLLSEKYTIDFPELLAVYAFENGFFPVRTTAPALPALEQQFIRHYNDIKRQHDSRVLLPVVQLFDGILAEMTHFPVLSEPDRSQSYMFGDGWGMMTVMGEPLEATDIIDRENVSGRITVAAAGAGIVRQVDWQPNAGYTVYVEGARGVIFTYAFLSRLEEAVAPGAVVTAGAPMGAMGDYGGSGPAKLRFALHVETELADEPLAINPYPFLRLLETLEPV